MSHRSGQPDQQGALRATVSAVCSRWCSGCARIVRVSQTRSTNQHGALCARPRREAVGGDPPTERKATRCSSQDTSESRCFVRAVGGRPSPMISPALAWTSRRIGRFEPSSSARSARSASWPRIMGRLGWPGPNLPSRPPKARTPSGSSCSHRWARPKARGHCSTDFGRRRATSPSKRGSKVPAVAQERDLRDEPEQAGVEDW